MRRLTCKRPIHIFWYFISQLLVEISIWNSYRTLIGSLAIHWKNIDFHRSKVNVTGTVHCFLKVQSYHKNWAIENFQYFFVDTSLYALSNETITSQKNDVTKNTCKTPIPQLILLIKSSKKIWQSCSPVLVTIGPHLTSFVTCATFNL